MRCKSNYGNTRTISANEQLQMAIAARDRFLERNQGLRVYQSEIDRLLEKSGDCHGRMAVLGMLMQSKLLELQKELSKLSDLMRCVGKTPTRGRCGDQ